MLTKFLTHLKMCFLTLPRLYLGPIKYLCWSFCENDGRHHRCFTVYQIEAKLFTRYSLLVTFYSLLVTFYLLLIVTFLLLVATYLIFITFYSYSKVNITFTMFTLNYTSVTEKENAIPNWCFSSAARYCLLWCRFDCI